MIQMRTTHFTVFDKYIFYSSGSFATYNNPSMSIPHNAVFYYNIFGGNIKSAYIFISTTFYSYTFITILKNTVINLYICTGLEITSIVIRAIANCFNTINCYIFT